MIVLIAVVIGSRTDWSGVVIGPEKDLKGKVTGSGSALKGGPIKQEITVNHGGLRDLKGRETASKNDLTNVVNGSTRITSVEVSEGTIVLIGRVIVMSGAWSDAVNGSPIDLSVITRKDVNG